MYRRMLVLLDGSKLSEVVFKYAQELSGRLKLDLELLYVSPPQEADELPMRRAYVEHMAEGLRTRAEEISAEAGHPSTRRPIRSRATVVLGQPAEEILKYARKSDIDLVMMTTRGRSGVRSSGIGSVAKQVIHDSPVPVWLVPSELQQEVVADTLPKRTLVIPLDGSKLSETVIPHAVTIATQRGAESELILLYTHDVGKLPANYGDLDEKEVLWKMKEYLDATAHSIREAGFSARTHIQMGDAAPAIVRFVEENPPQLLAMTTHGRTGLRRMIYGSVAEQVIERVKKTPMLLVSGSAKPRATMSDYDVT